MIAFDSRLESRGLSRRETPGQVVRRGDGVWEASGCYREEPTGGTLRLGLSCQYSTVNSPLKSNQTLGSLKSQVRLELGHRIATRRQGKDARKTRREGTGHSSGATPCRREQAPGAEVKRSLIEDVSEETSRNLEGSGDAVRYCTVRYLGDNAVF